MAPPPAWCSRWRKAEPPQRSSAESLQRRRLKLAPPLHSFAGASLRREPGHETRTASRLVPGEEPTRLATARPGRGAVKAIQTSGSPNSKSLPRPSLKIRPLGLRALKQPLSVGRLRRARLDVECVDVGGATFGSTVAFKRTIPFGAISAFGWQTSCDHLCGFLGSGIELGCQLTRLEEETRNCKPPGIDHDEVTRRFSMRRLCMRTRCLASEALTHFTMLPRLTIKAERTIGSTPSAPAPAGISPSRMSSTRSNLPPSVAAALCSSRIHRRTGRHLWA